MNIQVGFQRLNMLESEYVESSTSMLARIDSITFITAKTNGGAQKNSN